MILQQVINGLMAGSVYALIALGLTLIFGVLKILQLAHGEVIIGAAFVALVSVVHWQAPFYVALLLGVAAAALLGLLIEALVLHPLMSRPSRKVEHLSPLIATIGVSLFLQNLGVHLFSSTPTNFPDVFKMEFHTLAGVDVTNKQILLLAVTLVIMVLLAALVQRTRLGKAIQATAESPEIAGSLGINVRRIVIVTMVLGSAVGAVGGTLFGVLYNSISPFSGVFLQLKGLVAMIVGGVGSMTGAVLAGFVIGIAESVAVGFIDSSWRDAIAFGLLVVLLLFRPQGIFGRSSDVEKRV